MVNCSYCDKQLNRNIFCSPSCKTLFHRKKQKPEEPEPSKKLIGLPNKPDIPKTSLLHQPEALKPTKTSLFCKKHHRMAIGGLFPCGCSS